MHESTDVISWDTFSCLVNSLSLKIKKHDIQIIIAIQRGGLVPGVCLSHLLKVRNFITIKAEHSENDDINPFWKSDINFQSIDIDINGKSILIIDDIVGTGKTMIKTKEFCEKEFPASITTAALFIDEKLFNNQVNIDYYQRKTKKWIVFPWEEQ